MNATIVDLRCNMKEVLNALERREEVTVLHHGKVKGIIKPPKRQTRPVADHPFFGSSAAKESVLSVINRLRGSRSDVV